MKRLVYGLAAGVLAGALFIGLGGRGEPVETEYRKMEKDVMEHLRENSFSRWPKYEPFRNIPFLERVTLGEFAEGRRDINTKYGELTLSVNADDYFCISSDDIPIFFADIDGNASPDEVFSCRWTDPNFEQKSRKRKIEDIQQPYRLILKGVYRTLLKEAHRQLATD